MSKLNNTDRTLHDVQAATMGTSTVQVLLLLLVLPAQVQFSSAPTPSLHPQWCVVCVFTFKYASMQ